MPTCTSTSIKDDPGLVSLLGGLERGLARQPEAQTLRLWHGLVSGGLDFPAVLQKIRALSSLTYLAVDTTGVCDLRCPGMCYYHPAINIKKALVSEDDLQDAIRSAYENLNLKSLVFSGKEPLQNTGRLVRLSRFTAELTARRVATGLVTNGRAIASHWGELNALAHEGALTFLDISLDSGWAQQHDQIRGISGTFARALAALQHCTEQWPQVRLGVTSVLRSDNAAGILELLRTTSLFNRNFFIAPIQPPPFTSTSPLPWSEISTFIQMLLHHLATEQKGQGIEVTVSLLGLYLWEAQKAGFFDWADVCEDDHGQLYVQREVEGNQFLLQLQVFSETSWRIGRITYTGAYLPNTHFLQTPRPDDFAIGYIQDEPFLQLYQRGLLDESVLGTMLGTRATHACRDRPCWSCCFGGLSAAEHSFVGGAPLEQQPRLCLKTSVDFE